MSKHEMIGWAIWAALLALCLAFWYGVAQLGTLIW